MTTGVVCGPAVLVARHVYGDDTGCPQGVKPFWNFGVSFVYIVFAISGFVILPTVPRSRPGAFAWQNSSRIYPLFLAGTVLFIILNSLAHRQLDIEEPATNLFALTFSNLIFGTEQLILNAWSLSSEAVFCALVCTGTAACSRGHPLLVAVVAAASLAFLLAYPGAVFFLIGMGVFGLQRGGLMHALPFRGAAELLALSFLVFKRFLQRWVWGQKASLPAVAEPAFSVRATVPVEAAPRQRP